MTTDIDIDGALDEVLADQPTVQQHHEQSKPDPYIAALAVDDLFADHTYQRELDEYRVIKMAADFKIAPVGIIEVSQRPGGRYAILDGQHRWATVRDVSFDSPVTRHLACRIHVGLNVTEEAALYHELNTTRRQLTGWDRWLARRGAGDPVVRDIETLLARHGLKVALRGGDDVFRATRTAEKIVELSGLALLDEVVGLVRASWPDDQNGMEGNILHGLGHVLDNYSRDELDTARLVEVLSGVMPRQLSARAAAVRELHKGTLDRLAAHVIVERYNASKGPKLEPFFVRVKPVSKTMTTKAKAVVDYRTGALAWAKDEPSWTGRHNRVTPALRAAYDAHLVESGGGCVMAETTTDPRQQEIDHAMVEQIIAGQPRSRQASHAECAEAYRRLRARGLSTHDIERDYGLKSDRYPEAR